MKKYYFVFLCFVYSLGSAQTNIHDSILRGKVWRSYILYIPKIYNPAKPTPLVFNFHGLSSSDVAQEAYGDFRPVADTANFILALPQGLVTSGSAGFSNFGTVAAADTDIDFVSDLIDTLEAKYNINANRIYSTGYSNGGFMSYDLACFFTTKFAAIASVCGSMIQVHLKSCSPTHQIPIMEIHGTTDPVVSYSGTGGIVASTDIDTLVKFWVDFNKCSTTPVITSVPNISTSDNCTATHYVYSGTGCNSVEFYQIVGGGHTWPGTSNIYPSAYFGYTNEDFNASVEIWRFFSGCSKSVTGVNELYANSVIALSPNPSKGVFAIQSSVVSDKLQIEIYNALGEKILVKEMNSASTTINISNNESGIYLYRMLNETGGLISSGKLVVQK